MEGISCTGLCLGASLEAPKCKATEHDCKEQQFEKKKKKSTFTNHVRDPA